MESTLNPNQTDPRDVLFARADEELAHAYEQIKRANEELARADEQFSKLERDAARQTSAKRGNRPSLVRGFTGLLMAACIGVAAIVWQSSYGAAACYDFIAAAGKNRASRAAGPNYRSGGRRGGSTFATGTSGSDRTGRRRAD